MHIVGLGGLSGQQSDANCCVSGHDIGAWGAGLFSNGEPGGAQGAVGLVGVDGECVATAHERHASARLDAVDGASELLRGRGAVDNGELAVGAEGEGRDGGRVARVRDCDSEGDRIVTSREALRVRRAVRRQRDVVLQGQSVGFRRRVLRSTSVGDILRVDVQDKVGRARDERRESCPCQ